MRHPDMDGAKQKFHLRVNALGPAQERRRRGEGRTLQGKLYTSTQRALKYARNFGVL